MTPAPDRHHQETDMTPEFAEVIALSGRFRKRPVVIEATQWRTHGDHPAVEVHGYRRSGADPHGISICAQCHGDMHMKLGNQVMHTHGWVDTLEGGHVACPGDWIITGVKGEHYPCKPDIFAATYEPESTHPTPSPGLGEDARDAAFMAAKRAALDAQPWVADNNPVRFWKLFPKDVNIGPAIDAAVRAAIEAYNAALAQPSEGAAP